jgi:hypothetical protein
MSQFKCVAQTNGIRGLTHKHRLDRMRLLARNASSPRCGGSVWNLRDFCRASERCGRGTCDP